MEPWHLRRPGASRHPARVSHRQLRFRHLQPGCVTSRNGAQGPSPCQLSSSKRPLRRSTFRVWTSAGPLASLSHGIDSERQSGWGYRSPRARPSESCDYDPTYRRYHKGCWIFAFLCRRIVAFGARGTGHEYLFVISLVARASTIQSFRCKALPLRPRKRQQRSISRTLYANVHWLRRPGLWPGAEAVTWSLHAATHQLQISSY